MQGAGATAIGVAPRPTRAQIEALVEDDRVHRDLYLSFVNFSFAGDEGDVFGNVLAIQSGLADAAMAQRIVRTIDAAHASQPYPLRVVLHPLSQQHELWRAYMGRHRQNIVHQYHNGGIWPFVGGFWVSALAASGDDKLARTELAKVARANALEGWQFNEWLHGRTLAPSGMPGQSWNAAAFLMALRSLEKRVFEGSPTPFFGNQRSG